MTDKPNLTDLLEPGERERPTLKTIARISGLAVPTVSRALSDAPDIGQDTKKRVRELADQLGYRPNRAGLRLRTGKTNVVAVVIRTEDDVMSHGLRLITAIATELRKTPYHVIITPYFPDEDPLDPVRYIVRTGSADGIIMNRTQPNDPRVAYLREQNFPFAIHGRTGDCGDLPYFDFDNGEYGRKTIALIRDRGRRNLLLIAPPRDQNYAQLMIAAVEEFGAEAGIAVRILDTATSDSPTHDIQAATLEFLRQRPETDAIMNASVPSAVGATLAAEALGRTVGADIDIIAKESRPFLEGFRKEILLVHEDIAEAGQFLARAVLQAIDQPHLPPMQKLVLPE